MKELETWGYFCVDILQAPGPEGGQRAEEAEDILTRAKQGFSSLSSNKYFNPCFKGKQRLCCYPIHKFIRTFPSYRRLKF